MSARLLHPTPRGLRSLGRRDARFDSGNPHFASPLWGEADAEESEAAGEGAGRGTSLLWRSRVLRHPELRSREFAPSPSDALARVTTSSRLAGLSHVHAEHGFAMTGRGEAAARSTRLHLVAARKHTGMP